MFVYTDSIFEHLGKQCKEFMVIEFEHEYTHWIFEDFVNF